MAIINLREGDSVIVKGNDCTRRSRNPARSVVHVNLLPTRHSSEAEPKETFYAACAADFFFEPRNASLASRSDACQILTTSKTITVAYVTATQTKTSSMGSPAQAPMLTPIICFG